MDAETGMVRPQPRLAGVSRGGNGQEGPSPGVLGRERGPVTPWVWAPGPRAESTNPCGLPTHLGLACVCAETPYTGLSGGSHALGGRCEDRSQVLERPRASRRLCPVPEALPRRPCPPGPSGPSWSGQKARSLSTLLVPASGQPQAPAPH